jgi:beta-lactamase superfamily II metal-dependent hydrolase
MWRFYWILFFVLVVANVFVYKSIFAPTVLKVSVLEVGKGSAALVQTPSGKSLLVDTGVDASILRALGGALPMWQRRIDAVIITSKAASAAGGLPEVTSRYHINNLIHLSSTEEHLSLGEGASIDIISSPKGVSILRISYGSTILSISSSTPPGVYTSDGKVVTTK